MTDFYSEVSKLRNSIENEIIDTMVKNGLKEFSFERPLRVTNNEVAGEGKVYQLALDVNNDNDDNMLVIYSTWGGDDYDVNAEYYNTTEFFIEDLCEIHSLFIEELNRQKKILMPMEKIKILSDYGNVYEPNTIISIDDLLNDYKDTISEEDFAIVAAWDERKAVEFIADAWGLEIEFLS